jgi:glucose dehydrogenase
MLGSRASVVLPLVALLLCGGCHKSDKGSDSKSGKIGAEVAGSRIIDADHDPGNWLTHGRTYSEQRFSPLKQINHQNASRLGLAWYYDLDTNRGQESTPLVVDGVMYFTTAWSKVVALNAATGALRNNSL